MNYPRTVTDRISDITFELRHMTSGPYDVNITAIHGRTIPAALVFTTTRKTEAEHIFRALADGLYQQLNLTLTKHAVR